MVLPEIKSVLAIKCPVFYNLEKTANTYPLAVAERGRLVAMTKSAGKGFA
jgi:hypothetical protein